MSLDEGYRTIVREVVREEIRAALAEYAGVGGTEKKATYAQAAKFAECSPSTIQAWVKSGVLPATGKGKLRRVLLSDVSKALASMQVEKVKPVTATSRASEILGGLRRVR